MNLRSFLVRLRPGGASRAEPGSGHPYLQGRREFERFFGDLAERRRTWQTVAIAALALNAVLTAGYVRLSLTHRVVPYVVELDALGETRLAAKLAAMPPPERAVVAALRRFVHNLRTVPSDARLLNVRLRTAQAFAAGQALESMVRGIRLEEESIHRMLQRADTRYVTEISGVLRVPGGARIYRVTWREKTTSDTEEADQALEGYFELHVQAPEDEAAILENPLGIFVTDYTLSRLGG